MRDIPLSGSIKSDAYTLAVGDAGNHVVFNSANVNFTVPATTFGTGDVVSVISTNGATATVSCAITNMFVAEGAKRNCYRYYWSKWRCFYSIFISELRCTYRERKLMVGIHQLLFSNFSTGAAGDVVIVQSFLGDSTWTCPLGVTSVDYLVIAGAGGGGGDMGGGGGAGAFRIGTNLSVTPDDDYTITVGGGGAGSPGGVSAARGTPGDNSSIAGPSPFTTFTSTGGGGGSNQQARLGGGSGGGGGGKGQPTVETGGAAETITPITDETTPSVVQITKQVLMEGLLLE